LPQRKKRKKTSRLERGSSYEGEPRRKRGLIIRGRRHSHRGAGGGGWKRLILIAAQKGGQQCDARCQKKEKKKSLVSKAERKFVKGTLILKARKSSSWKGGAMSLPNWGCHIRGGIRSSFAGEGGGETRFYSACGGGGGEKNIDRLHLGTPLGGKM